MLYSNNSAIACYARNLKADRALIIVNTSEEIQKGSVFFAPGMPLEPHLNYEFSDLYHPMKDAEHRASPGVRPQYTYNAKKLMTHGLYVELQPFDAHIFVLRPRLPFALGERLQAFWNHVTGAGLAHERPQSAEAVMASPHQTLS